MGKQYRDEMSEVCLDMMKDMYTIGAVNEEEMREFEEDCFAEEPEEAAEALSVVA
ncbi:MAG: hypothetical protein LBT00_16070 [Spirochaetaceae bacterium]|jgi:hypothetical protein|nr:hypothetical protein [Spirochaetaceae bacterium]